jgi:hypothetical protein
MESYGGVEVLHHHFISTLDRGERSASRPRRFTPVGHMRRYQFVCPRACLDFTEKRKSLASAGNRPRFLGRPARILVAIPAELSRLNRASKRQHNSPFTFKLGSFR